MTYRENFVCVKTYFGDENGNLKAGKGSPWIITGGTFEITEFDVTKGQDPKQYLKAGDVYKLDKDLQFLFKFGRHGSSEVAGTFNKLCPPARNTFNHTAGKLNFWVKGTLTLTFESGKTFTFPNTFFAQGHSGASNNWWFGNDGMENSNSPIFKEYQTQNGPLPIYLGKSCYGLISPQEDANLLFYFNRGSGATSNPKNAIQLVGMYCKYNGSILEVL